RILSGKIVDPSDKHISTDAHLELLRQIASMLDRKEVRDKLRSASSNEALYQVVLDEQNLSVDFLRIC
ncbi:PTS sugar transporter subunit IIA, partial [Klebsiella pneumoniae]